MKSLIKLFKLRIVLPAALSIVTIAPAFAAGPPKSSVLDNNLAVTLTVIAFVLLLIIGLLSYILLGTAQLKWNEFKKSASKPATLLALFSMLSLPSIAQDAEAAVTATATNYSGLSATAYYTLIIIIAVELVIIFGLLFNISKLIASQKQKAAAEFGTAPTAAESVSSSEFWKNLWQKINAFKPQSKEDDILLDHNYDGIRELDNNLPPWWLWSFYITIIFSGVYLWQHHVSKTAPDSIQEYEIAVAKAELKKEEYLKNAKNLVDENTVTFLDNPADIEAGKKNYTAVCAACHGADGGGVVGPNLADEYWIHGGSINDIFKTIKYGYIEKGMKSWKDDFSPVQIAQIASYVKSLKGSKPANPKAPEGEIYNEGATEGTSQDSITTKSTAVL